MLLNYYCHLNISLKSFIFGNIVSFATTPEVHDWGATITEIAFRCFTASLMEVERQTEPPFFFN